MVFGLLGFLNELLNKVYHEMANTQSETAFFRKIEQIKQDVNWVRRVMAMMRVILVDTPNLK